MSELFKAAWAVIAAMPTARTCSLRPRAKVVAAGVLLLCASAAAPAQRVAESLILFYEFNEGSGSTVGDTSGSGDPLDLTIEDVSAVSWGPGILTVEFPTIITNPDPATVDGEIRSDTNQMQLGDTSNWDPTYRFTLAHEFEDPTADSRSWRGDYHLVAVYNRALSEAEIVQNFDAGPEAGSEKKSGEGG